MTAEEQPETALRRPGAPARARPRTPAPKVSAPFPLRCGAFLIDYIVLASIVATSTLIARTLGGGARLAGNSTETLGVIVTLLVAFVNFGVFAAVWGRTIGKWATGLRIVRTDGLPVGVGRIALRHLVG